ncbi:hydrogenase maturation protease [Anabaena subtropica]|uniref:Hydrogenase maturation protease n=1 Tax=Anabaena subtropica FACHB-260 TaxID=2692884 RepID=A0ABR8CVD7_9NOST|nr:hydrogenase maturation protease [Anabaena subtropica]MBD2346721.1 hydrogenase maturation protease [Anabaena subtropica FACHB-260]
MKKTVMVIGYGNDLRSDDGIGQWIANEIASWHLPSVESVAVHQLTPDLVDSLASVDLAIFVDACLPVENFDVQVQSLLPACDIDSNVHTGDPRSLLALTEAIHGNFPVAWWVTIPGMNFEVGDRFSRTMEAGKAIALVKIVQILDKVNNFWVESRAVA